MEFEKQIYNFLIFSTGGHPKNVQGVSLTSLDKLKNGKSGISTKKLKEILRLNGLNGILTLHSKNSHININIFEE